MKYILKIPLFLALLMCHEAALGQSDDIQSFTSSVRQDQYLTIVNPYIPNKISFAGQDVDFDNVDLYERLDRELTSMIYTHGNTLLTIKRANRYFPIIIPILKQYGLHSDFAYLACVESYLSPLAKSNVGAAASKVRILKDKRHAIRMAKKCLPKKSIFKLLSLGFYYKTKIKFLNMYDFHNPQKDYFIVQDLAKQ
jgi:hypothetical protein